MRALATSLRLASDPRRPLRPTRFPAEQLPTHPSRSARSAAQETARHDARVREEDRRADMAFNRCKARFERQHRPRDIISGEASGTAPRASRTARPERRMSAGAMMRAAV